MATPSPVPAGPAFANAAVITPSQTTILAPPPNGLWIGVAGTLVAVMAHNSATVTLSVGASTTAPLPLCVTQVLTATTATGIIGLW